MTVTDIISQARTNRHGNMCPAWCATDHSPSSVRGFDTTLDGHWNGRETVTVVGGPGEGGHALAYAYQPGLSTFVSETRIVIDAHADRNGRTVTYIEPTADDACGIAGIVEALAHATPKQHLQLAAQLRAAAHIVTFGGIE